MLNPLESQVYANTHHLVFTIVVVLAVGFLVALPFVVETVEVAQVDLHPVGGLEGDTAAVAVGIDVAQEHALGRCHAEGKGVEHGETVIVFHGTAATCDGECAGNGHVAVLPCGQEAGHAGDKGFAFVFLFCTGCESGVDDSGLPNRLAVQGNVPGLLEFRGTCRVGIDGVHCGGCIAGHATNEMGGLVGVMYMFCVRNVRNDFSTTKDLF